MPRPCSICLHPERQAMDQALAAKEPYRNIAERYGTSPPALHRHQQRHAQPPSEAAPPGGWPALGDTARRVHASACQTRDLTRNLRSTREPALLDRIEDVADVLVEISRLLVVLTTVPSRTAP